MPPDGATPPDVPIIDPHHHLWPGPGQPFLLPDFVARIDDGLRLEATVYVECRTMYRRHGPKALRSLGETEFASAIAAMSASGAHGPTGVCAGIVAFADLRLGRDVGGVIEAHRRAAGGRLKGVRFATAHDPHPRVRSYVDAPGLLADGGVREGIAVLASEGLVLDVWVFHHQIGEVAAVADAFPDLIVVLDHMAAPLSVPPYDGARGRAMAVWGKAMAELARRPNVRVKLGGLGMKMTSQGAHRLTPGAGTDDLAALWRPLIIPCIEWFGPDRCMFESNAPMDFASACYGRIWRAFARLCAQASADDKALLFHRTARATYLTD